MSYRLYTDTLSRIDQQIAAGEAPPQLLLHSCCGPCSTSVITMLTSFFRLTVFYYNPNTEPFEEYELRKQEQIRFLDALPPEIRPAFIEGPYDNAQFRARATPLALEKEGGSRCIECISLRLENTAVKAKELSIPWFTSTLSVSPHKNAQAINRIGTSLSDPPLLSWLYSDFKKNDGYKKSVELSREYNLYRQEYCGCLYSRRPTEE
ncbi:MAG: epoxyqueuosine reductase QueH [Spirochaetales bacterium]|nr:epoxyqueuosine reductase QueH [Spirochaetales bacterium]